MPSAALTEQERKDDEYEEMVDGFLGSPDLYLEEYLGLRLWSGMRLVARSAFENKRTSVRGCHGISKTTVAAAVAVAFLNLHQDSVVVTTAPTGRQVRSLLWKEIRAIYARCFQKGINLRGVCQTLDVKVTPECYMIGFSTDQTTNIEGWHAPHILFVIDEAKGIPQDIYDALEGSMIGDCHMLEISTTDGADQQCPLRRHHSTERSQWEAIRFSAFDSPLVDPDSLNEADRKQINTKLRGFGKPEHGAEWKEGALVALADAEWIEDRRRVWEQNNPYMWETKVLGEFSDKGGNAVIPLAWVERAIEAEVREEFRNGEVDYGLDVARMGDDQTVLYARHGWRFSLVEAWGKTDTMATVGKVKLHLDAMPGSMIKVDAIGVGAGVFDRLAELLYDGKLACQTVYGVNTAERSRDSTRFYNRRAEMWWAARELFERNFQEGGIVSIPNDPELVEDLTGMKYGTASDGRILVEKKEEFKKRFGRSPNRGDAFVNCLFKFQAQEYAEEDWR